MSSGMCMPEGRVQTAPPIDSLSQTQWTKPSYTLPSPSLQFLFHLECDMESFRPIGEGPNGNRMNVIFKGGRFEGPRMRGKILPGGGDWEIVRDHQDLQIREALQTAYLDTRYNLETHDGAVIYLQTTGTRTGKKEILEKLGKEEVKPTEYRMRLTLKMETGDPKYSWVNDGVFIASSGRVGDQVIYDAYQVV